MVIVAALPGATAFGEIEVIAAVGLFTLNVVTAEPPPPGAGFTEVIMPVELPARSAASRVALTSVALTKVVERAAPFQSITVVERNPEPVISNSVSAEPAMTLGGVILVIAGAGLFTGKLIAADVPPPGAGLTTVNLATAPLARSLDGMVALRLVEEPKVVASGAPFHSTEELEIKPEPATVTGVSEEPAAVEEGVTLLAEGAGF